MIYERRVYELRGIVQGVGFRPTLARMAAAAKLGGSVVNMSDRVRLELEGPNGDLDRFIAEMPANLPANARIEQLTLVERNSNKAIGSAEGFKILASRDMERQQVVIPADLSICPDCSREIITPEDRRYGYPFTTCTACGPRYTVVNSMPYDRERTTLADFPLCADCMEEYENPADRRFHAESIACPACGPRIWLESSDGERIEKDVLAEARAALAAGKILAVRGIGGFLLAADAFNPATIAELRRRKRRPHKPFAVMGRSIDVLRRFVELDPRSEELLESAIAPILIAEIKADASIPGELINADIDTMGVMLPTSPLHMLLFKPLRGDPTPAFELLIMTSGNRGGEPICIGNREAREGLKGIADCLLLHNREINLRNDDSLFAMRRDAPQVWRRARGCAPNAIAIASPLERSVMAMGAELKNAIAIGEKDRIFLSPHIGDLDTPQAVAALEKVSAELPAFLKIEPEVVAVDMHPDMRSTRRGELIAARLDVPIVQVQHHHAHAMACLAEHGTSAGLALVMDGTGLGDDGNIWGAEMLEVDSTGYRRLATFDPVPLPGGDAATVRPARQLAARFIHYGMEIPDELCMCLGISETELQIWRRQIETAVNTPYTSAAGRVFDAFSALIGCSDGATTYDAQAAIRLEGAARRCGEPRPDALPFNAHEKDGMLAIDWMPAFETALSGHANGDSVEEWAHSFHRAMAAAGLEMIEYALAHSRHRAIALTGGVMMNGLLCDMLCGALESKGISPLIHELVPTNDGGIAMGQAAVAGSLGQDY